MPAQLSTDRLLSLANAGCPLRLAVLLLAAVRSPPSCPLVLLPVRLSTDRLLSLAHAGCLIRLAVLLLAACCCCLGVLPVVSYRPSLYRLLSP